jgi:leader peptidase (prepilin peptidase)/N-methyltransferase
MSFPFLFALGCCIGSFLNVVIYRVPRGKSLVRPPSACPSCGEHIRCYDNIPLLSWLMLGCKCRRCGARISARYFVIELLTGLMFVGVLALYFKTEWCSGVPGIFEGGWFLYVVTVALLSCCIAASAIDLELWVIPLSICWFLTLFGILASTLAPFVLDPAAIRESSLLPTTTTLMPNFRAPMAIMWAPLKDATVATLSAGAAVGLAVSWALLASGLIKRSYDIPDELEIAEHAREENNQQIEPNINHRLEMLKELAFLFPVLAGSVLAVALVNRNSSLRQWWFDVAANPHVAGLLGSLWGYFIGCGVVWITRILGTLGFGKEAMGLGDVHLMGAVGAVIGPDCVVAAFLIAPFFGLGWAVLQMFFKKTRQIPYGPFLSTGVLVVIIAHDWILRYIHTTLYP